MGGATSSYVGQCVDESVPLDADLVLVEFTFNDWQSDQTEAGHRLDCDAR
jgi:hypothetical protein